MLKARLACCATADARDHDADLILAADQGDLAVVNTLLSKGANVHKRDAVRGETALHKASAQGHAAIVTALLAKGANVQAWSRPHARTPLHEAVDPPMREPDDLPPMQPHDAVIDALLVAGANFNARSAAGESVAWLYMRNRSMLVRARAHCERAENDGLRDAAASSMDVQEMHRA